MTKDAASETKESDESTQPFPTQHSSTRHTLEIAGETISYQAEAGWITLRKIHKPIAQVFHAAYLQEKQDASQRPLTFVFNGGPGAASAFLHMGALGPQRVQFGDSGSLPKPPTRIVDNQESWLSFSDLVFIDPVGTGFSRALQDSKKDKTEGKGEQPEDPKENAEFWELERDLESLGEFICRFLSKHHRWTSPIFIAGESYGGFRVAKMAKTLQEDHGVGLSGALLISPAIELDALAGSDYDLTYWVELFPSLAAAAFRHGRVTNVPDGTTLDSLLQIAETFSQDELIRLLVHGEALDPADRRKVLTRMSELCGLSVDFLDRSAGRITSTVFCRELLREGQRLCGHYDASVTTVDPFPDRHDYDGPDPTLFSIDRLFSSGINHQLRATLEVETDLDYRLLSMQVNEEWKDDSRSHFFNKVVGAMDDLRYGMSLNGHMKVFICHGYFDLVTPYFSTGRLVNLMKLTPEQRENLVLDNYLGGHMFYSWDDSRVAFHAAAKQFYESSL